MNSTEETQLANLTRTLIPSRKWLLVPILLLLVVSLPACGPQCAGLNAFHTIFGIESLWQVEVTPNDVRNAFLSLEPASKLKGAHTAAAEHALVAYGMVSEPPYPAQVELIWTPPPGASGFQFSGPQPEPGGPPFVWHLAVGPDGTTASVQVSYDPPEGVSTTDTVTLRSGGEETSKSIFWPQSRETRLSATTAAPPAGGVSAPHSALQGSYYLWETILWIRPQGVTMTTELCQDCVDSMQSDAVFLALRFPVHPPSLSPTDSYTLPVVFRGEYSPTLSLVQLGPYTKIFTAPLEYRPQYHTFAENELPAAPGERWLALGVASTSDIVCPPGLEVSSGDWLFEPQGYLDFGGVKDTCADCVLPLYYCYKGQELPASLAQLRGDVTSYQGWGITCLGPHALRLETPSPTAPPFVLGGQYAAYITATQTISFSHHVMNQGSVPVTVTLDYTSELGLNWDMYAGTFGAPDIPLVPITNPVALATGGSERIRYFWMIATVPEEGAPSGAESLIITAADVSSPDLSTWTSDVLWVGDWVKPPPPPMPYKLYLPLVLRQSP